MLKYFILFAALSAAVLAQDNLMDDLLEQEMEVLSVPTPWIMQPSPNRIANPKKYRE
jgi:hypothetical protein